MELLTLVHPFLQIFAVASRSEEVTNSSNIPNQGIEPRSPALQADSLPSEPPRETDSVGNIFVKEGWLWNGFLSNLKLNVRHIHYNQKSFFLCTYNTCLYNFKEWLVGSVAQSCPTPCNPMNCSTPGLPAITNSWSSLKLRPLSQWCHPAISSSVIPFSSCPQSLPASESFPMSQLFTWDGQSIF